MSAVSGRDGRISPPPAGDEYVRDPAAARAEAIRERVAVHRRRGEPVPRHLQMLFDQLGPVEESDIDLVDATTGDRVGQVKLVESVQKVEPEPVESPLPDQGAPLSPAIVEEAAPESEPEPTPEPTPEPEPEPEPAPVAEPEPEPELVAASTHSGEGALSVTAQAVPTPPSRPVPPAPPAPRGRGRPPKKAAPQRG